MQYVVLAGGLGKRLREVTGPDLPKPMAAIGGRPFLEHLLDRAIAQGVTQFHLLVGYNSASIIEYFGSSYGGIPVTYSIEKTPLGTGGALKAARRYLKSEFILANGDTFVDVSFAGLLDSIGANLIAMSLCYVQDVSQFGSVCINDGVVHAFNEKGESGEGLVNAGVYACRLDVLDILPECLSFSFEGDFLQPRIGQLRPRYLLARDGMVDIGTPSSYLLANRRFGNESGNDVER